MFRKPTLADIYVQQIKTRLDRALVPVYSPDTPNIRVGTIGRFRDGAFERRGHLEEIVDGDFATTVPLGPESQPSTFTFQSESNVKLAPGGTVSAGGVDLVTAKLSFSGERSVVASFTGLVERSVASPRTFDDLLWKLYLDAKLAADEVVVWLHREAAAGTVLVNRKGNVDIEVSADPKVVGTVLSFANLGLGVTFGSGSQAPAQLSGTKLTFAVGVKGLTGDDAPRIDDIRGFAAEPDEQLASVVGTDVPAVTSDEVIGDVDFDTPED